MSAKKPRVEDVASESDFNSLTQWLMTNTKDKELTVLMAQLALACKATSRACAKAGIANLFGMAGDQNSSGGAHARNTTPGLCAAALSARAP